MLLPNPERLALKTHVRGAIDRVDDGLIVLLAARRLARAVAVLKPRAGALHPETSASDEDGQMTPAG